MFLDQPDPNVYKKEFAKIAKMIDAVKHLNHITALTLEPKGTNIRLPDGERVEEGKQT
jgi:hypothetical protein